MCLWFYDPPVFDKYNRGHHQTWALNMIFLGHTHVIDWSSKRFGLWWIALFKAHSNPHWKSCKLCVIGCDAFAWLLFEGWSSLGFSGWVYRLAQSTIRFWPPHNSSRRTPQSCLGTFLHLNKEWARTWSNNAIKPNQFRSTRNINIHKVAVNQVTGSVLRWDVTQCSYPGR